MLQVCQGNDYERFYFPAEAYDRNDARKLCKHLIFLGDSGRSLGEKERVTPRSRRPMASFNLPQIKISLSRDRTLVIHGLFVPSDATTPLKTITITGTKCKEFIYWYFGQSSQVEQNSKGEPVQFAPWVKKVALIVAAGERICQQTQLVPSVTFSWFNSLFQIMANSLNHFRKRFLNGCQSSVPSVNQHITWEF